MTHEYQIKVHISFGFPIRRVQAEDEQEAVDKAHEIIIAMDDFELLELIKGAQYRYDAFQYTCNAFKSKKPKKYTDKEVEKMREGQEGKE